MDLKTTLLAKIEELGSDASEYFGVSKQTIAAWKNGKADALIDALQSAAPQSSNEPIYEIPDGSMPVESDPMLWQDRNLIVLIPSYKETNPLTMFCLLATQSNYKGKVGFDMEIRTMIHKARNILLTRFMRIPHKPEWAFFVDDDMIIPTGNAPLMRKRFGLNWPEQFLKTDAITRLTSRGKTLIGGLYFGRGQNAPAMYAEAFNKNDPARMRLENEEARTAPKDLVKKTYGVATGCMLIHRSCVEAIEQKFPDVVNTNPSLPNSYFTPKDHLEGEDMAFCRKAAAAGHPAYVDFSVVCGHLGQRTYWPHNING